MKPKVFASVQSSITAFHKLSMKWDTLHSPVPIWVDFWNGFLDAVQGETRSPDARVPRVLPVISNEGIVISKIDHFTRNFCRLNESKFLSFLRSWLDDFLSCFFAMSMSSFCTCCAFITRIITTTPSVSFYGWENIRSPLRVHTFSKPRSLRHFSSMTCWTRMFLESS